MLSSNLFRTAGVLYFLVGIGVTFWVGEQVTRGGLFSSGREVGLGQILAIGLCAFYHVVSGMLCLGVANSLDSGGGSTRAPRAEPENPPSVRTAAD